MRKVFLGVLATIILLSACVTTAFAAGPWSGHHFINDGGSAYHRCGITGAGCGKNFIHANGNGVCDRYGTCVYTDVVCDICGTNHGNCLTGEGSTFADADGDGICDNCGAYHQCGMAGAGYDDTNFENADRDGVYDSYETRQGGGNGQRNSAHCGHSGNFADANRDGVQDNDNYASSERRSGHGCGGRHRSHH